MSPKEPRARWLSSGRDPSAPGGGPVKKIHASKKNALEAKLNFGPPRPPPAATGNEAPARKIDASKKNALEAKLGFKPPKPPREYDFPTDVIKLQTALGQEIAATFVRRRGANVTILFSHGNAEDLNSSYWYLERLAKSCDVNVMCYDYTGYGSCNDGKYGIKKIWCCEVFWGCWRSHFLLSSINTTQENQAKTIPFMRNKTG